MNCVSAKARFGSSASAPKIASSSWTSIWSMA